MPVEFKKAERKRAWLKLALTGPSGSGKTLSALLMAAGTGCRIAVIDTENGSASLYSNRAVFDVVEIDPPYTVEKYIEAIQTAVKQGYEILIIDSISHAWAGEGGLLQQKEALDERGAGGDKKNKNSYTNWASITKQHEKFKAWLLAADIHLICTMRSKQDYVLGEGNKPVKVGMAPIQREGMEYEFTTVLDIAMNHTALATKDRTSLFGSRIFQPSEETGAELMSWLMSGKEPEYVIPIGTLKGKTLSEVHPADLAKSVASAQKWLSEGNVSQATADFIRLAQIELNTGESNDTKGISGSPDIVSSATGQSGDGASHVGRSGGTPESGPSSGDTGASSSKGC